MLGGRSKRIHYLATYNQVSQTRTQGVQVRIQASAHLLSRLLPCHTVTVRVHWWSSHWLRPWLAESSVSSLCLPELTILSWRTSTCSASWQHHVVVLFRASWLPFHLGAYLSRTCFGNRKLSGWESTNSGTLTPLTSRFCPFCSRTKAF